MHVSKSLLFDCRFFLLQDVSFLIVFELVQQLEFTSSYFSTSSLSAQTKTVFRQSLWSIGNKRPMGHITYLRKQFKSINTYDYIITLIKRRKNSLFTLWELNPWQGQVFNVNGSSVEQPWIPFTQWCFLPNMVAISQVVLDKQIFKCCQCIFAIL